YLLYYLLKRRRVVTLLPIHRPIVISPQTRLLSRQSHRPSILASRSGKTITLYQKHPSHYFIPTENFRQFNFEGQVPALYFLIDHKQFFGLVIQYGHHIIVNKSAETIGDIFPRNQ